MFSGDGGKKHLKKVSSQIWNNYAAYVFALRLLSVALQKTCYVPDEFYQSTDVVHNFVLNQTAVTWEWHYPIRTSLWLFPVAMLCRLAHSCGVYHLLNVQTILRLYCGLISGFGELALIDLSTIIFASLDVARSCFLACVFSWYQFYSASRALNNPVEVTLFILAFRRFALDGSSTSNCRYLLFAGISILVRSSGVACYLALFLCHFYHCRARLRLLFNATCLAIVVLAGGILYDFMWFGRFTFSALNFVWVNVVDDVAVLFGHMGGWSWYLTQGFPVINGLSYPLGLYGLIKWGRHKKLVQSMALAVTLGWVFMEFGCAHKEFRYVHWSYPFFTLSAAQTLQQSPTYLTVLFAFSNSIAALYMALVHQRGPTDLLSLIQRDFCDSEKSFTFYGPCHIIPGEYSRYCASGSHLNIRQLKCDRLYKKMDTEVDIFHRDPSRFVGADFAQKTPDFAIFFDGHSASLAPVLEAWNFTFYEKIFHAHFPNDDQTENILVYNRAS